jgi:uncharacterized membrane protein
MKFIQLLTGFLLVLISGVFWGTRFTLSRSMASFPVENFILNGITITENVAGPMSIMMPATIIGLIILSAASWKSKSLYFYCMLASLLLLIASFIITLAVEVPIDNQIISWTAETIPSNWEDIRDHWQRFHTMRTFAGLASVLSLCSILNKDQ